MRTLSFIALIAIASCHRAAPPAPLPPAQAHCGSGIGQLALCTEWSGTLKGQITACDMLRGTWKDGPCPPTVSSTGGTCEIRAKDHQGRMHYGSAWKLTANNSTNSRAQTHCEKLGGIFIAPKS